MSEPDSALLRPQLVVLQRNVQRPKFLRRDRAWIVFSSRLATGWQKALLAVQPTTVLRWHRDLFRLDLVSSFKASWSSQDFD
jgi:hypothetical protein